MIRILILITILNINVSKCFAYFGDTCAPRIPAPSDNTSQYNSLYGYLISHIDPNVNPDWCSPGYLDDDTIMFCYRANLNASGCVSNSLKLGETKKLGELMPKPHLGGNPLLKDVMLSAVKSENKICITMPSSQGPLALICRNINASPPNPDPLPVCKSLGNSCYSGESKSQSLFNFTGVAVHCLQETLGKVFYRPSDCTPDPNAPLEMSLITPFPQFQQQMTLIVRTALALYIIFYGIRIAISPGSSDLNSAATFVIKALLVLYFSVGLGPVFYQDGKPTIKTGMLDYVLPTLTAATPEFARIVFTAGGARGLCDFDLSKYPSGYKFYGLWDAIDCRIGYYLGISLLYDISDILNGLPSNTYDPPENGNNQAVNLGNPGKDGLDVLSSSVVPKFFVVMFGFLLGGNIIVVAAGIAFAIVFISVILHFLSSYLVCIITLYTMTYISPLFIPMVLFNRTKSYYDSWLRIVVSCALQPAVLAGFVALLLNMYDSAIYKNCEFRRHDYQLPDVNFSTFELRVPASDPSECLGSAGYKFLKYYIGQGWEHIGLILIKIHYIRDIFSLMSELLYVIVFTIIFYYFSQSMSQFAADITSGPMMNAVTTGPTKLIDAIKSAASFISQAAQTAGGGKPPGGGARSSDMGGRGRPGGPSGDTASLGGSGSSDTGSLGGGGSLDTSSLGKGK